jgi:hypothetical protein
MTAGRLKSGVGCAWLMEQPWGRIAMNIAARTKPAAEGFDLGCVNADSSNTLKSVASPVAVQPKVGPKPGRTTPLKKRRALGKVQRRWISPPKDGGWARLFVDMLEGDAWRGLSINARRAFDALIGDFFDDCQKSHELQISFKGFERAGVTRCLVGTALHELVAAGFIDVKDGPRTNLKHAPKIYSLPAYQNAIGGAFVWVMVEILQSHSWRNLSINARRCMDRLLLENARHRGELNGQLRVSFGQFEESGVNRRYIKRALDELDEAGFLEITARKQCGIFKGPNLYRLTIFGTLEGPRTWKPSAPTVIEIPKKKPRRQSKKAALFEASKIHSLTLKGTPGLCLEGTLREAETEPEPPSPLHLHCTGSYIIPPEGVRSCPESRKPEQTGIEPADGPFSAKNRVSRRPFLGTGPSQQSHCNPNATERDDSASSTPYARPRKAGSGG